jgi:hypothetical protein
MLKERNVKVPEDSRWLPIPLFPGYWISQYGQVFSMSRMQLVSPYLNQHGCRSVRMYTGLLSAGPSRGYSRTVAKLVREVHSQEIWENPEYQLAISESSE